MSDIYTEKIKEDISGFETQQIDLQERKNQLSQEIDKVDAELRTVESVKQYAVSLLNKLRIAPAQAAKSKKAEAAAPPLT